MTSTLFICTTCSYESVKWQGKCPNCGAWNSLVKQEPVARQSLQSSKQPSSTPSLPLNDLAKLEVTQSVRMHTGSSEFDRVLGGGLLAQSVVLISGEPGIGKSTLLLQLAANLSNDSSSNARKVLYVCGEESQEQIKLRANRLGIGTAPVLLSSEFRIEKIEQHIIKTSANVVVIDSIQSMQAGTLGLHNGNISQLRACIQCCYEWSQNYHCAVIIVAHVTKDGAVAGPKVIEHLVDTVLIFENSRENLRFLYSRKNRFGAINEVGVFDMSEKGLIDLSNSSHYFLEERQDRWPSGICIVTTFEGSRPFLVEIQALTVPVFSNNRVFSEVVHSNQVFRIAAILERHVGIILSNQNIYINTAGGIRIQESGVELALALALYSAYHNQPLAPNTCAMGEISLAGEIRSVQHLEQRSKQAEYLGVHTLIVPKSNMKKLSMKNSSLQLIAVSNVQEAIQYIEHNRETQKKTIASN